MTSAGRQRVCGIVVNTHTNAARDDYDRLRAAVHQAGLHPELLDAAAYARLQGRIGWVEALNPGRGAKLHQRLDRIERPA
jgi:hypothetical protein